MRQIVLLGFHFPKPSAILSFLCAAVAQMDRVLGYEPRGRGFESCQPHHLSRRAFPIGKNWKGLSLLGAPRKLLIAAPSNQYRRYARLAPARRRLTARRFPRPANRPNRRAV